MVSTTIPDMGSVAYIQFVIKGRREIRQFLGWQKVNFVFLFVYRTGVDKQWSMVLVLEMV